MAGRNDTIFLLKYLMENTDSEHPATSTAPKSLLKENGYACDSRTIRSHIKNIFDESYNIIDKFGLNVQISNITNNTFEATATVAVPEHFSHGYFNTQGR